MIISVTVHELGHYLALRLFHVSVEGIDFGITGIRLRIGALSRGQELLCALAGPLAGLSMLLLSRWLPRTAVCACIHAVYNLLPVYPLDGGRILRCVGMGEKVCDWIERICLGLIGLTGLYGWIVMGLGCAPVLIALLTIHRTLVGKGLANRRGIRYNGRREFTNGVML